MKLNKITLLITVLGLLYSCNNDNRTIITQKLDYSNSYYWASLPTSIEKDVDVFFVYPTLFGDIGVMNMDIKNDSMRSLVQTVLSKQAAIFNNNCNIYAPYYRQMAMDVLSMDPQEQNTYFSIGLADVEKAFDYYIDNLNNGRPFILAGHSQGSMVLIQVMKDRFNKPELMNKLVAAYIIGYSVTDDDLAQCKWLKIAESADDIGTIITYNTQSEFATGSPVLLPNANCVTPLNWKNTSEYAPKEMNLGAVFFNNNGTVDTIVAQYTDAWIDERGALAVNPPNVDTLSIGSFPTGVFHKYDYSFFFNNLKENVGVRVNSFKQKNRKSSPSE
jgi:alpha/beta superfamily hydrolase